MLYAPTRTLRIALMTCLIALPFIARAAPQHARLAPNASFISAGKTISLAAYHGHPIMLWQVATWCGSCKAGLRAFARNQKLIDRSPIRIIVLRDYKNGGYPGISITKFAAQVAPSLLDDPYFVFGNDSKILYQRYNPNHDIDIYDLINTDHQITLIGSTPSATFGTIKAFINAPHRP